MVTDIISGFFLAVVFAGLIGFIYKQLLLSHGFNFAYLKVACSLAIPIFLLSFHSIEAAGVGCVIVGGGAFVLAIAMVIRSIGAALNATKEKLMRNLLDDEQEKGGTLVNYYGMAFHLSISVLMAFSIYHYSDDSLLSEQRMAALMYDAAFQFDCTLMLVFIGICNPFQKISEKIIEISTTFDPEKYPKWHAILSNWRSWSALKALICLFIITYFINKGFLNFPKWSNNSQMMNGYVFLTGIFIMVSLSQLIRNPKIFFKRNLFRVAMLFQSVYVGIFVAAILILTVLLYNGFSQNSMDQIKAASEVILFLGFNLVMAYNEYKIASR